MADHPIDVIKSASKNGIKVSKESEGKKATATGGGDMGNDRTVMVTR